MEMNDDEAAPQLSSLPAAASWSPTQWEWSPSFQKKWHLAPESWKTFMEFWMQPDRAAELNHTAFPHTLTIFPSPPFSAEDWETFEATSFRQPEGRILVFERYAFLYHGINKWQRQYRQEGVIIAGQPGIGKSLLLWYFLIRLIHDKQPVLLHLPQNTTTPSILFYGDNAWCPNNESAHFKYLPRELVPIKKLLSATCPVMLVDSPSGLEAPGGLNTAAGWPIYAVSPRAERYHEFRKVRGATLWGLDLWSPAHLRKGLELQDQWPEFLDLLTTYLASPNSMHKIPNRLERVIKIVGLRRYASWSKETPSDWVDILLDNAIYWHGFTPRSVFRQVLFPVEPGQSAFLPSNTLRHIESLLADTKFPVYGLSTSDAISEDIIALRVQPHSLTCFYSTVFSFVIGSAAILEQLQKSVSKAALTRIKETFYSSRAVSGGMALAAHIFAAYALKRLEQDNPRLPLQPMTQDSSSDSAEPLFISALEEMSSADTEDVKTVDADAKDSASHSVHPVHRAVQFLPTRGRATHVWHEQSYKLGQPSSLLTLGHAIFVPFANDSPLFDAFFLDVPDAANQLFRVLWVIQFTTRRNHKGSSEGYLKVRKLREQAGHNQRIDGFGSAIHVEVRWVLITPTTTEKTERQWQMPPGWDSEISHEDHRGSVLLQEMDFC